MRYIFKIKPIGLITALILLLSFQSWAEEPAQVATGYGSFDKRGYKYPFEKDGTVNFSLASSSGFVLQNPSNNYSVKATGPMGFTLSYNGFLNKKKTFSYYAKSARLSGTFNKTAFLNYDSFAVNDLGVGLTYDLYDIPVQVSVGFSLSSMHFSGDQYIDVEPELDGSSVDLGVDYIYPLSEDGNALTVGVSVSKYEFTNGRGFLLDIESNFITSRLLIGLRL